jgi:tetratricopeptide (TPR) repeat protein
MEVAISRRGLPICFMAVSALFVLGGWVRPPLSTDIRAISLPLGVVPGITPTAEQLLESPRHYYWHSAGALMFLVIALGTITLLIWPKRLGTVAGLVLAFTIAAHCAVLNQPNLIELLDLELAQRRQLVLVISNSPVWSPLTNDYNGRIQRPGLPGDNEVWGDPSRGTDYLVFGQWLAVWALAGCIVGTTGPVWRRLGAGAAFSALGIGLLCGLSLSRIRAEYQWYQAKELESIGDYASSTEALNRALDLCPGFEELQRTWLLSGKLDLRNQQSTPREFFFRAYQLKRDREYVRAFNTEEDLQWEFTKSVDPRNHLAANLVTPDEGVLPELMDAPWFMIGVAPLQGKLVGAYGRDRVTDRRRATDMLNQLLQHPESAAPAVRHQAADFWVVRGLLDVGASPTYSDSQGRSYAQQDQQLNSAKAKWEIASRLEPDRVDCPFYLGLLNARLDPERPEAVEQKIGPLLPTLGDRVLHAEAFNIMGDSYLNAGRLQEARVNYAHSLDLFNLPKVINYAGQKGLGGL